VDEPKEPTTAQPASSNDEGSAAPVAKKSRWPFSRRRPSADLPAAAKTATSSTAPARKVPWLRRSRWRVFVARTVSWGMVGIVLLLLLVYGGIRVFVKPEYVRLQVIQLIEEQTGGRLDVARVQFNVLTGIRLEGVKFYPPLAGDTRGFLGGGGVESIALASLEALDLRYSVPKLLAGRAHIRAMQLLAPQFHLEQRDGIFNFASILAYRERHFPAAAASPPVKVETGAKPEAGAGLLPFSPALIYLPIEVLAQNIGIKDLQLELETEEHGHVTQSIKTKGLTFDVGVHWFGRESSIWFNLISPFERPFELSIRATDPQKPTELKQSLLVKSALNLRLELENLQKINVDFAMRLLNLTTPVAGYRDVGAFAKMRLAITDDYKGLNFDTFQVDLADALTYELGGLVSVEDARLEAINLKLKQKFNLDLKNAATLAQPFLPGLRADGDISLDDFKVDGQVAPAKLAQAADGVGLPRVSGVVWLEDVQVDYPGTGVSMEPISGAVSLAAGPALDGAGSQIDLSVDMTIPKIEARRQGAFGDISAGFDNLVTKVTARALWPEMIAPILKINVEADHVRAHGDKIPTIDVPLFVDIDADGRKDLARLAFAANLELTDLAEIAAAADCQAKCARFRASAQARMDSLAKLHAIVLPLGAVLGLGDFMPTKLSGGVDFQFSARGKLADPTATPVADLIKTADVRFNTQLNLAKLSAEVPFYDVDLTNFETRLLASGSLAEQKIDFSQKFDSVSLELPKAGTEDTLSVDVDRFSFETSVTNSIDGPLNLATLTSQLTTGVKAKLYLGRVAAEGILPHPISDFQFGIEAEQAHLTEIKLTDVSVKAPDYGASVNVSAEATIDAAFMPKQLKTRIKTQIVHTGEEKLPGGIKTTGRVDVDLAVESLDMKLVALDGQAAFDKYNVTIPAADGKGPPTLVIEDIKGQIPFKQVVRLPDFGQLKMKSGQPVDGALAAAKTDHDGGASQDKDEAALAAMSAAVPQIQLHDDGDNAPNADGGLEQLMNQYFEKNDDKLLASTNLVALVDYGTIRPFYPERRPLSIKRVEVANLELSNMEFDLELRQNWFALNQFVINFLGGKIQGDFQLAFDASQADPKQIPRGLRTSVHMTRLDTRKLIERFPNLAGKASSWNLFSNPYIDGTVHLLYDLKSNDISGGVEITSIGKEQLRMMLFYVDPFEQNPTIGDIRKALALGEVRQVSIPLKNGEVGMEVDVRVLSAPIPTPKLSRFPISQILQNFKDQAGVTSGKPAKDSKDTQDSKDGPVVPAPTKSNSQAAAG